MPKRKKWYFYDSYKRVRYSSDAYTISEVRLPRRTNKYYCATICPAPVLKTGETANLVFGDPRLLRRCTLVEKGISRMPEKMRGVGLSLGLSATGWWWTLRWKEKLVFVCVNHLALAKTAKRRAA